MVYLIGLVLFALLALTFWLGWRMGYEAGAIDESLAHFIRQLAKEKEEANAKNN